MAWQLKMSHQNSSESKRSTDFVSVPISRKNKGDCSSDLNLGRLADFVHESSVKSSKSLPSPSSKRPRAPINGNIVFCLVDDCRKDLGNCREYHRRHKVCETHSKTPMVTVDGKEQRFCQQCSRFHLLTEFDEGKRSCRKRLDGHNKRRRKPQHDPLSFNTGSFLLNPQGNRISSHLNPQFDHTTMNLNWFGSIKTSSDVSCHPTQNLGNQARSLHTYFSQNYKPQDFEINLDKMSSETLVHNVPVCPPLDAPLFSENCASLSKLSDGWTRVFDTGYAPSLLSSTIHQNAATSFAGRKQVDQIPIARSSVPSLHFSYQRQHISELSNPTVDFCCSGLRKEPVLISDAVSDGQPENGTSETPPFSWH